LGDLQDRRVGLIQICTFHLRTSEENGTPNSAPSLSSCCIGPETTLAAVRCLLRVGCVHRRSSRWLIQWRFALHEARHTFVSLMFDAGMSLERIGDYVGHSSTYMTDRYRHLLDGHEAEAAGVLDAYLERRTGAHTGADVHGAGGASVGVHRK
jgi:integrase